MDLSIKQKVKLTLLKDFGSVEEASKAFDFVMNYKETAQKACCQENCKDALPTVGLYLLYSDGHHEEFTGDNPRTDVTHVGVLFQGHTFAVGLNDLPQKYELVRNTDSCEKDSPFYKTEIDSLFDWDAESSTRHIVEAGTDIPLNDGEFIPTAAMLTAMYRMREDLNKALEYVGGEPLKTDDWYWSSSEISQHHSWILHFGYGYLYNGYKCYSYFVRPCPAFEL